jgi:hypothetical protein
MPRYEIKGELTNTPLGLLSHGFVESINNMKFTLNIRPSFEFITKEITKRIVITYVIGAYLINSGNKFSRYLVLSDNPLNP